MLDKPSGIPRQSGCYLFRNAAGTIIYVGKARVLAQRLSSYFQRESGLSQKTQLMMADAASVEWIVTPTELDALILENELIKDNQPRYNMRLKDDKSFPFVALDARTPFPAPYITRAQHVKGCALLRSLRRRAARCARRWTSCSRPSPSGRAPSTSSSTNSASGGRACSTTSASARGLASVTSMRRATPSSSHPGRDSSRATCASCAAC